MSRTWFTADLHLGHWMVADLRGFEDTAEHDATICDAWADAISIDDTVFVLGDIAVSSPRAALDQLGKLPGRKHLVAGNHDTCHPMHRNAPAKQAVHLGVFTSVMPFARRRIAGHEVLLSHFPYVGDHSDSDRHAQWRLPDMGLPVLHGHTHSGRVDSVGPHGGRQVHVGVDAWGLAPVSSDEVAARLAG